MLKTFGRLLGFFLVVFALPVASSFAAETLTGVALKNTDDGYRLQLDLSAPVKFYVTTLHNPERVVVDLVDTKLRARLDQVSTQKSPVKKLRSGIRDGNDLRLVLELKKPLKPYAELVSAHDATAARLSIDLLAGNAKPKHRAPVVVAEPAPAAAKPIQVAAVEESAKVEMSPPAVAKVRSAKAVKSAADAAGQRDVIIAIDAGHGGDDPGAIGAGRVQEKQVTLAIARELAAQINRERGYKAVLTRDTDFFIPLKTRRDLARRAQADLMVSIHADSFADKSAEGGSVFALSNRGATSTMAAFLAESENNADAIGGVPVEGKDDDLVKVLTDFSLTETMNSSLTIGRDVLHSIHGITRLHSERVEQAAFVVLKSPDTPSILVETGFVSNPREARRLSSHDYQQQMARAIFSGVNRYFSRNPPPNSYLAAKRRASRDDDTVASAP